MSSWKTERQLRELDDDVLNDLIQGSALVPAIRAYLVFMNRHSTATTELPYNAQYLLREAAQELEKTDDA